MQQPSLNVRLEDYLRQVAKRLGDLAKKATIVGATWLVVQWLVYPLLFRVLTRVVSSASPNPGPNASTYFLSHWGSYFLAFMAGIAVYEFFGPAKVQLARDETTTRQDIAQQGTKPGPTGQ